MPLQMINAQGKILQAPWVPYVNAGFPRYMFRLQRPFTSYLFATAPIPLDPAKQVKSITLPNSVTGGGAAHIFTYAVS